MINQDPTKILDGATTNGIGRPLFVEDFNAITLSLHTTGSAAATVKFQVSYQKTMPDFSAAQSPTNSWDFAKVLDIEDGASIDGDTGVVLSGTDDNRNFNLDVDGATWINAIISGRSAGVFHLTAKPKVI